jgi:hypothetical protein
MMNGKLNIQGLFFIVCNSQAYSFFNMVFSIKLHRHYVMLP